VTAISDFECGGVGSPPSEFATIMVSQRDCIIPSAFWDAYFEGGRPDARRTTTLCSITLR
jgi:hypothetical protein